MLGFLVGVVTVGFIVNGFYMAFILSELQRISRSVDRINREEARDGREH